MFEKLTPGQEIESTIVAISGDTVFIDMSAKSEGVISSAEFADENGNEAYEISIPQMEFADQNRMKIKISYTVKVPVSFAGLEVTEVDVPVTVTSNYDKKF